MVVSRCLKRGGKIVVPLGGGETAVAEHGGGDPHVIGVMDSDRGSGTVAEEVRVHWPTKGALGALSDGI